MRPANAETDALPHRHTLRGTHGGPLCTRGGGESGERRAVGRPERESESVSRHGVWLFRVLSIRTSVILDIKTQRHGSGLTSSSRLRRAYRRARQKRGPGGSDTPLETYSVLDF